MHVTGVTRVFTHEVLHNSPCLCNRALFFLPSMAPTKKSSNASPGKPRSSSQPNLKRVKGENFYRNAKAASRLKMMSGGKPTYDRDGKVVKAAAFQSTEADTKMGRIQPDRRWFGK